ncbi:MAG: carboxypeptidase regulatory-like domain-containing protein [Ruminococcaceae bacterium]|nr:carboxypeptidase regulatory-like domain-containing protein [Oscillospiraceae bacterium]
MTFLKKSFSLILAFAIVIGLVPAFDLSALAVGNEAVCSSFAELKSAMENPSVEKVTVKGFIEDIVGSGEAISVVSSSGKKTLELDGAVVLGQQTRNSGYENLIRVGEGVRLTVTGAGSIHWNPALENGTNAMVLIEGGDVCFDEDFTGLFESKNSFSGLCGPVIEVSYGHLLVKNGKFTAHDTDVTYVRGVIETASAENTVVALLGGSFSYSSNQKGSYVIVNNCENLMIHNFEYSTTSGLLSKTDADVSVRDYSNFVTWEPFGLAYLPNFPMAATGESAELSFRYQYSNSSKNKMFGSFLKSVTLQEVTGNTRTVVATFENSKVTHNMGVMDQPTVKNYKIVFEYGYEYGGEWHSFCIERDLRAEWKDLSYDGDGTAASPVRVSSFEELRRALFDVNVEYVELCADVEKKLSYLSYDWGGGDPYGWKMKYWQGQITAEELYQHLSGIDLTDNLNSHDAYLGIRDLNTCALNVQGRKHLILSHDLKLSADSFPYEADDSGFMRGIQMNSDLTISGGGTFEVTLTSPNYGNAATAIMNDMGSLLVVEDAKIIAKTQQYAGYARAIMTCGSSLIINGGEFRGQQLVGDEPYTDRFTNAGVVSVDFDSNAEINGGTFGEVQLGESGTCLLPGLLIDEEALKNVTLNGGTFETGIMRRSGQSIELLEDEKIYSLLKVGASFKTETNSVSGVGYTTHTVTPSTVVIPEGAGTTPENPVFCDSYFKFKYAMESSDILYVALGNVNETIPKIKGSGLIPAISVNGIKHLNVLGDATFTAPAGAENKTVCALLHTTQNAQLTVTGLGSLKFRAVANNSYNAVIYNQGGSVIVDGATLIGSFNTAVYGKAIWQDSGELRVSDGHLLAENALSPGKLPVPATAVYIGGGEASICGGTFKTENKIDTIDPPCGLDIDQNAVVELSGGVFHGIVVPNTSNMADYVKADNTMTVDGVESDPKSFGTVEGKCIEVYKKISEVDLLINAPTAGKDIPSYIENVYGVPEYCRVQRVTWLEDGEKPTASQFIAGKNYTVEIALTTNAGARFANPPESATVNFKNATVTAQGVGAEHGIILILNFGVCPAVISEIELTIDPPKQNGLPDQSAVSGNSSYKQAPESVNMFDAPLQWFESSDGTSWTLMDLNDTYTVGYYYKVFIDVMPLAGYKFALDPQLDPDVTATVNSYNAAVSRYAEVNPDELISVCYNFGQLNDNIIEQIDIEGITEPVVGSKPSYGCAVAGTGYTVNTAYDGTYGKGGVSWYDVTFDTWLKPDQTFRIGHEYKVFVDVKAVSGYEFYTESVGSSYRPKGWGYINGAYATLGIQSDARLEQSLSVTFTCKPQTVKSVAVDGLQVPVAGAKPDFTAATDSGYYKVTEITWFDCDNNMNEMTSSDTFKEGCKYYLTVQVEPAEEEGLKLCKFLGSNKTTASLNGVQVQKISGDSWQEVTSSSKRLVIWYVFDHTPNSTATFSVSGSVEATQGSADGTTVQLISAENGQILYQTTVSGGAYSIPSVKVGLYTILFAKDGFVKRETVLGVYENVKLDVVMTKDTSALKGDVNGSGTVDTDDAIHLLFHINFSDTYPVNQPCDFDGNGIEDTDDAIHLLFNINFPDGYPLH